MADFLLVHGAWHGGWCWRRVSETLCGGGHRVHAVTLTGLGERAHLLSSTITLETHIADVMCALESEELHDVVLVAHSYAGMLGTAVADRLPSRLRRLVYLDAVVPSPGESWGSTHSTTTREGRLAAARASPDFSLPAPDPSVFGLSGDDAQWVQRRMTAHPGHTYTAPLDFEPARVAKVPRTFISCTDPALATVDGSRSRVRDPGFWSGHWQAGSAIVELRTGHDPMISAPHELSSLLASYA
ncbi:alpha/beta hydrolase [Ramlibacter sp. AW1]|uniref:Alpha/beta hydrolase n=1 Tax=Ramlibacter aurantiacus TaxID=2801330 RepID=A0A936ZP22_9BURK|nr:alpha/beta hydrolase family protein [Ramlibacter aurantiacus]MBL0423302.1 alpha/beta hydrolase [Ramlibacter aurantiacus]